MSPNQADSPGVRIPPPLIFLGGLAIGLVLSSWEPTAYLDRDIARPDAKMTVTERFTRSDKDTLLYQFTVNDPGVYTRSWSGEITMKPFDGTILEYACTEANQALYDIMSGARVQEKEAAGAARK